MDLEGIRQLLIDVCGMRPDSLVLVGLSGGPDSLCLLDVFLRLDIPLVCAHLDHGLRDDSRQDAQKARDFCAQRGLSIVCERKDVAATAKQEKMSIEEAARFERYHFLFSEARKHHAAAVTVAHTADDQVETVLMHLLRGAGLSGLKGMAYRSDHHAWDDAIPIIRPFLGVWRAEVVAYCDDNKLDPVIDRSNYDTTFFRNRLRHELIPYLEDYNPQIKQVFWRMSRSLEGDAEIVQAALDACWARCVLEEGKGFISFSLSEIRSCSKGNQRNLFRAAMVRLMPALKDISFDVIERALSFTESPARSGQIELAARLLLMVEEGRLVLLQKGVVLPVQGSPQIPLKAFFDLERNACVDLADGWRIEATVLDPMPDRMWEQVDDPFQAWFDLEELEFPLQIRARRSGDRMQPLGLDGNSIKLSDLFVNVKLPRRLRDAWPLVCCDDQIIWVPGHRTAHSVRVQDSTRRVLHLRLLCQTANR